MSNNAWKQYGGISKNDGLHTVNASTIIADQFISRSTRPTYQFLTGTFEVSLDLSAGVNMLAGNSIYSAKDVFVNRDVYTNNKLFFGNNTFQNDGNNFPALASDTTHAYMYGNSSKIGVNTVLPKTVFNITGTVGSVTDILTVESGNAYIRNIVAQNVNKRGIVMDADDTSANILFYTDVNTNKTSIPDATIKYQDGGVLNVRTTNRINTSARSTRIDTSGGTLFMDATGTFLTSKGQLNMDISGEVSLHTNRGYLLDTSGGRVMLDQSTGNIQIDASNELIVDCSGGTFLLNDNLSAIRTVGNIQLLSTGPFGQGGSIVFDSSGGNIDFNSGDIKLNTLLKFAPPGRGVSNELLHDETLTVYDNSNQVFLYNVYNDTSILTGNAATFIGKDPSANSFIFMNPAANKLGSAVGGGMVPYDASRSMAMVGLTDANGNYIHSQMTVSSINKYKYPSTLGINTYRPRTEDYVLDVNGPMHLGNGEINTIAENSYEITHMNFSKTNPLYGIAVGSPSTTDYTQYLLITNNGGKTWSKSDIFITTGFDTTEPSIVNHVHVFDSNYSAIAINRNALYLTNNSGVSWYRLQLTSIESFVSYQTINIVNNSNTNITGNHLIIASYKDSNNNTRVSYFGCNLSELFDVTNFVINVATIYTKNSDISITSANTTPSYVYYAGTNGIARYQHSKLKIDMGAYASTELYSIINNKNYHDIYAYNDTYAIAVGVNIISYTTDGLSWTHIIPTNISLNEMTLNSVFIYDLSNAVAVGSTGEFIYSTDWSSGNWQLVPEMLLNSSGMSARIRGPNNNLKAIYMPDVNTMIIADATKSFIVTTIEETTETQLGYSKIQYCFLPNIFNRTNNTVFDVSGNMVISGDIEVFDGELLVNTIDYKQHSVNDVSGTIDIGTKTHVVNIGKTDGRDVIDNSNRIFDNCESVINIGVTDPEEQSNCTMINLGNYKPSGKDYKRNLINIGGGWDKITIGGDVTYTNTAISSSKNKGFQINDFNLNDGIIAFLEQSGILTVEQFQSIQTETPTDSRITGITYDSLHDEYLYTFVNAGGTFPNPTLETYLTVTYATNPFGSAAGAGLFITDNLDRDAGYLKVSQDMSGWVMKPTNIGSNAIKFDVNSLTLRNLNTGFISNTDVSGIHDITNGIVVLTRTTGAGKVDASYALTVKQIDISNVLVRDSKDSTNNQQVINTSLLVREDVDLDKRLFVTKDVTFKDRLFVLEDVSLSQRLYVDNDVSLNKNLYVHKDTLFNGNVDISGTLRATYLANQTNYVINTVTNNYEFILTTDMSMSGNLYVHGDTSLNGIVDISGYVAIGKHLPAVALDISYTDAIRIPHGTTGERPTTTNESTHGGYIRYNTQTHQFEGYGPGSSWGSLGGVINVAQNTKISAEASPAGTNNDLRFYTAPVDDTTIEAAVERMRIDGSGNVGIGTVAPECTLHVDISNNKEETFWTSMFTNTSLKSRKNADLEHYVYGKYPDHDFKVVDVDTESGYIGEYINYRTPTTLADGNTLPYGVTDLSVNGIPSNGSNYEYAFDGTNLDLENYVNLNLSILIGTYSGLSDDLTNPFIDSDNRGSGVTRTGNDPNYMYTYDFSANNIKIEYHFIKKYIENRIISTADLDSTGTTGLPYGVSGSGSGSPRKYKYDFVKSIGSAIGKNLDETNNSAEIKYWHIDDLSTSNALSFGFYGNSNKMFIRADGNIGVDTINPRVALDISHSDAIRIPVGITDERPIRYNSDRTKLILRDSGVEIEPTDGIRDLYLGAIRYNSQYSQFEGFGPGYSWGSLGGVINIAQNTKITAEASPAETNNQLRFYTAYDGSAQLQMIIDASSGGVAIGTNYSIDVSNGVLGISDNSLLVEGKVGIGTKDPISILDVSGTTFLRGDVSMNTRLIVGKNARVDGSLNVVGDVSFNSKLFVTDDVSMNSNLFIGGNVYMNNSYDLNAKTDDGVDELFLIPRQQDNNATYNNATYLNYGTGGFFIRTTDNEVTMYMTNGNNVGIGTTNITDIGSYKLKVDGSCNVTSLDVTGDVSMNSKLSVGDDMSIHNVYMAKGYSFNSDGQLFFTPRTNENTTELKYGTGGFNIAEHGDTNTMFMKDRKVGIGTNDPGTHTLSVNGSVQADDVYMEGSLYMNNGAVLRAKNTAGLYEDVFWPRADNATFLNYGTGGFFIRNNDSNVPATMYMTHNGKVGIGTNDPGTHTLSVNGSVQAGNVYMTGGLYMNAQAVLRAKNNAGLYEDVFWPRADNATFLNYGTGGFFIRNNDSNVPATMFMDNNNNVGIGTDNPLGYKLNVDGNVQANSFNAKSDIRLKTNIQSLSGSLELINQLNGVSFTWIGDTTNKPVLGLIAQEVEKVLPEIVNTATVENESGYKQKSIHYDGLFPHLIESIKTLTQENKELSSKMHVLTQENKELSSQMHVLTQENKELSSHMHVLTQENKELSSQMHVLTQENKELSSQVNRIMSILNKMNISTE